jgi:choline dehydrogenase-like flavoprotein
MNNPDVLIIGSGVAGVSAAFPLVDAGLNVLMVDYGYTNDNQYFLNESIYNSRKKGIDLSNYLLGENFEGIGSQSNETPKMKVPQYKYVRKNYLKKYNITPKNINPTGSLSSGGLSNMWGAGVFPYIEDDLAGSGLIYNDLKKSYQNIAKRIGVSGADDDLVSSFGNDIPLLEPIKLHHNAQTILNSYENNKYHDSLLIGHNRNAVISKDYNGRKGCSLENCCLWGCQNNSIYNAQIDLKVLEKKNNFFYKKGVFVKKLLKKNSEYEIVSDSKSNVEIISAKYVCLAAGAIGSTVIACNSLKLYNQKIKIMCHPAFAFPLIFPKRVGSLISEKSFSLGQLAYSLRQQEEEVAFGILFSSEGILASDIANYMPSSSPTSAFISKLINPAILLANCYLPGSLSDCSLNISDNLDSKVSIEGNFGKGFEKYLRNVYKDLKKGFRKHGAYTIPGTLKISNLGSDGHFVGSIPMNGPHSKNKKLYSDKNGQISGLENVFSVDGASIPVLPPKHPTFTIMANADRIGREMVKLIKL